MFPESSEVFSESHRPQPLGSHWYSCDSDWGGIHAVSRAHPLRIILALSQGAPASPSWNPVFQPSSWICLRTLFLPIPRVHEFRAQEKPALPKEDIFL